jgi:hypothetical protein
MAGMRGVAAEDAQSWWLRLALANARWFRSVSNKPVSLRGDSARLPDRLFNNAYRYLSKINGQSIKQQVALTGEGMAFERDEHAIFPHAY